MIQSLLGLNHEALGLRCEWREEDAQRRREKAWRAVMRHPLSVALVERRR